jgi:hypothetical protein
VKKTFATIIGLSFIALGATACGPGKTPEGVCKKMESLAKDAGEKTEGDGGMDQCVKMMQEMEKQDKEAFGKMADCVVGAKDMKGATDCMMKIEPSDAGGDEEKKEEEKKE